MQGPARLQLIRVKPLNFNCGLPPLAQKVRLGLTWLTIENTLAYYNMSESNCRQKFYKIGPPSAMSPKTGNTNWGGRLRTVDLFFRVACFVKKWKTVFSIKSRRSKLVSTRRSTVLSLPPSVSVPCLGLTKLFLLWLLCCWFAKGRELLLKGKSKYSWPPCTD